MEDRSRISAGTQSSEQATWEIVILCISGWKGQAGKPPGAPGWLFVTEDSHQGWLCEKANSHWLASVRKEGIILFGLITQTHICGYKLLSWLFCKFTHLLIRLLTCLLGFGIKETCLGKRESPTDFFTTFGDFSRHIGLISLLHIWGWKGPLEVSWCPPLLKQGYLEQVAQGHVQKDF